MPTDTPDVQAPDVNIPDAVDATGLSGLTQDTVDPNVLADASAAGNKIAGGLTDATAQPAAPAQPVHKSIAQGILSAFTKSDGSAGGFLRSVLAGGLEGASAAASAPQQKGGGVAHGLAL